MIFPSKISKLKGQSGGGIYPFKKKNSLKKVSIELFFISLRTFGNSTPTCNFIFLVNFLVNLILAELFIIPASHYTPCCRVVGTFSRDFLFLGKPVYIFLITSVTLKRVARG